MVKKLNIAICICTFRRPHIVDTLRSVSRLVLQPHWNLHIIVADNDDSPSARDVVEITARENNLPLTYIHAPARNISIARNACLDAATVPLLAFIDDDELVTTGWLNAMLSALDNGAWDVVLGPVNAIYSSDCSDWMRQGDFHSTRPVWVNSDILTGYTCNVLLSCASPAIEGLRFREELGRSGGEDTIFFADVVKAGGRITYAPEAIVTEEVPANRATLIWLLKRRFRSGQTHGLLVLEHSGAGFVARIKNILKASAKSMFCFAMGCFNILNGARMRFWMLRCTMHAGVVSRLLGKSSITQYGHISL